jgi:hypothetical protein
MTQNRFYSSVSSPTTLAAAISSSSATTVVLNSISGNPGSYPWTLLIDWGLSTQEAVSITQAATGSGPYTFANVTRGIDGTTAQTHANGAVAVHGVTQEDYNEPQVHISLATSGSGYPNVVHGLQNGSSVVGTTDTQTLTNKTLGATTYSGAATMSVSSSTGLLVQVTNTHSSPSNANVLWTAAGSSDLVLGVLVSGDTDNRFQANSAGKLQWGPGGSTAVDTDLYRSSAGVLKTDAAFVAGTSVSAATEALSTAASGGSVLTVTNTTGGPSTANTLLTNNSSTDNALGISVSGDTVNRLSVLASGKMNWGPGSSTSADTDLYRSAAGVLSTDETFTATTGLQVGSATTGFGGGVGVLGISNANTAPSSSISGGAVLYAQSGLLKSSTAAGLNQIITGSQAAATSPVTLAGTTTTINSLGSVSVPANDVVAGAVYSFFMSGTVSTAGSNVQIATLDIRWGGTTGTVLTSLVTATSAPALVASLSAVPILIQGYVTFTSTTAAASCIEVYVQNNTSASTANAVQTWLATGTTTGLTTSSTKVLSVDWTWGASNSSASNTYTINSSSFERIS